MTTYKVGDYVRMIYSRETVQLKSEKEAVLANVFKNGLRKATSEEIERYERTGK